MALWPAPPPSPRSCHNCASVRAPSTANGATLASTYLLVTTEVGISLCRIARRGRPPTLNLPPARPFPLRPPLFCGGLATHSISRAGRVLMTSRGRQGSRQVDPLLCSAHRATRSEDRHAERRRELQATIALCSSSGTSAAISAHFDTHTSTVRGFRRNYVPRDVLLLVYRVEHAMSHAKLPRTFLLHTSVWSRPNLCDRRIRFALSVPA